MTKDNKHHNNRLLPLSTSPDYNYSDNPAVTGRIRWLVNDDGTTNDNLRRTYRKKYNGKNI